MQLKMEMRSFAMLGFKKKRVIKRFLNSTRNITLQLESSIKVKMLKVFVKWEHAAVENGFKCEGNLNIK